MPPYNEVILSGGQLKSKELRRIIHKAYYGDESMAMLSQVIFVSVINILRFAGYYHHYSEGKLN